MRVIGYVVLTAILASIGVGLPASAVAQAPVSVSDPTPIAAYGGHLVWSRPDGAGGFRLVQRVGNGPVKRLPIPARSVPFDVDLGPTSGGHVLAVYTRCATEPMPSKPFDGVIEGSLIPDYYSGRGCDVYKLDLNGGREARYTKVNASDASEFWPTYWKGRLGFARVYDNGRGGSHLYVKDVASSRPSERLPGASHPARRENWSSTARGSRSPGPSRAKSRVPMSSALTPSAPRTASYSTAAAPAKPGSRSPGHPSRAAARTGHTRARATPAGARPRGYASRHRRTRTTSSSSGHPHRTGCSHMSAPQESPGSCGQTPAYRTPAPASLSRSALPTSPSAS